MKVGFIGFGNMAQALAAGLAASGALQPGQIGACARDRAKLHRNTEPHGFLAFDDAAGVAGFADVVVVAVKPYQVEVCEGIVVCERRHSLSEAEWQSVQALLSHVGLVVTVDTAQLGIAGTVCGCGPAFVAMFIEALADAAVKHGIVRADAYRMASQMVVGTGKLQLATGQHPAVMKDAVCSPGGTTIVGVGELERKRFRGAVIDAIDAIQDKK